MRARFASERLPRIASSARANFLEQPLGEGSKVHLLLLFLAAAAHVDGALLGLPITDDEEVGDLLPGVLPDLLLHAVLRVVHLDPSIARRKLFLHFSCITEVP